MFVYQQLSDTTTEHSSLHGRMLVYRFFGRLTANSATFLPCRGLRSDNSWKYNQPLMQHEVTGTTQYNHTLTTTLVQQPLITDNLLQLVSECQ